MNIDIELNKYISLLSEDEKNTLLSFVKKFTGEGKKKEYSKAIMQYNDELEAAVEEIRNGNFISHDDVIKESAEW